MPGHLNQNGSSCKEKSQYDVKNISSSEIIPCLINTERSLYIIHKHFVHKYNLKTKYLQNELITKQTQGILNLQQNVLLI